MADEDDVDATSFMSFGGGPVVWRDTAEEACDLDGIIADDDDDVSPSEREAVSAHEWTIDAAGTAISCSHGVVMTFAEGWSDLAHEICTYLNETTGGAE